MAPVMHFDSISHLSPGDLWPCQAPVSHRHLLHAAATDSPASWLGEAAPLRPRAFHSAKKAHALSSTSFETKEDKDDDDAIANSQAVPGGKKDAGEEGKEKGQPDETGNTPGKDEDEKMSAHQLSDSKKKRVPPPKEPGEKKPREICDSDETCRCAEGHRCIQTWPVGSPRDDKKLDWSKGADEVLKQEPGFVLGCPVTRAGHDLIGFDRYNKGNQECVDGRCLCVLRKDIDDGTGTEKRLIPSQTGDAKTLLPRFPMPNLDEKFVEQITSDGEKNKGTVVQPEPLFFDGIGWQIAFKTKYKDNMLKIMDHMNDKMKSLEKDIDAEYKRWEKSTAPDPKKGEPMTSEQKENLKKLGDLDVKAAETFEQAQNLQMVCSKMEDAAQRFGLADFGEAKGLNCHLDPKEKEEMFKAMDKLSELTQARLGKLSEAGKGTKEDAMPIDPWTAGPLASLAGPAQDTLCRGVPTQGKRSAEDRRRQANSFL